METKTEAKETKKPGTGQRKGPEPKFVTEQRFSSLENAVSELVDLVRESMARPAIAAAPETSHDKEVKAAGPDEYDAHRQWDAIAREILGDAVEWTGTKYIKGGGQTFTVCIAKAKSNAPQDYLDRHKQDLRSKEISAEGEAGVKIFCQLIKENLKRGRPDKR